MKNFKNRNFSDNGPGKSGGAARQERARRRRHRRFRTDHGQTSTHVEGKWSFF